jgi:hypothetical protein
MAINVSDNNPRINYTATSGQTVFTVPFEFFASTDLTVYVGGSVLSASSYTVTGGNGSTGSITTNSGQTAGAEIAIVRDVPLERTTDLTSTYSASSLNDQLDRLVTQVADLDDRVSRSISLNDYEVGVSLDLPAKASRLGKTVQFNSITGALEVGPSGNELTSIASIASEITALDGIKTNITTVAGAISNVNSVGSNISSVTSVASSISNVNTVNTNIANVNLVGGSIADLNDVADSLDQVELVGGSISNVDIVGAAISNVNTAAGNISNINTVASISSNITTVAGITSAISTVNGNATNINLAATNIDDINDVANVITKVTTVADNIANVNAVAPSVGYLSTVANNISNINTLAPISADITTVAGVASSVSSAAANAAAAESAKVAAEAAQAAAELAADTFEDTYLGAKASDPLTDNDGDALNAGDLYFNTGLNVLKVYDGSSWAAAALDASGYITIAGGTLTDNLSFGDNNKAIFGAGSDLEIYHNGNHSIIADVGTGNLNIYGENLNLQNSDGSKNYIRCTVNGAVDIRYDNSTKLATTSTGVDITGTLTSDGLTVDGGYITISGTSTGLLIEETDTTDLNTWLSNQGGDLRLFTVNDALSVYTQRMQVDHSTGDISFYEDTGTTAKFFWDASAERLSIGTNIATETPLTVYKTTPVGGYATALFRNSAVAGEGNGILVDVQNTPHSYIADFRINNSSKVRITSAGSVGIGTSSPSSQLHLAATSSTITLQDTDNASTNTIVSSFGQLSLRADTGSQQDNSRIDFKVDGSEAMRITSAGSVGIGTSSPQVKVQVNDSGTAPPSSGYGTGLNIARSDGFVGLTIGYNSANAGSYLQSKNFTNTDMKPLLLNPNGGNVGIGTSSPNDRVDISGSTGDGYRLTDGTHTGVFRSITGGTILKTTTNHALLFGTNDTERMRITNSGDLLVGKTSTNYNVDGFQAFAAGFVHMTADISSGSQVLTINRKTSDGDLAVFRKDGATVGSIGVGTSDLLIGKADTQDCFLRFGTGGSAITLCDSDGLNSNDGLVDLGQSNYRFDDIYATNGTIQTSDRNEKQDIAELSDAEQRVAVAAKGLLRKFRWRDAVEAKGDDARTHFGIIAQDLQAAFAAEGLDAGDYAMFISSTWTDEETGEERTRMGVRYSELLAFIIAAI